MDTIRCPHCRTALAETDGRLLYVGVATIRERTALHCATCWKHDRSVRIEWKPRATEARKPERAAA